MACLLMVVLVGCGMKGNAPPDTTITSQPPNPAFSTTADFSFSSNDALATFQWRLDSGAFAASTSPVTLTGLSYGTHVFQVRAIDA